MRKLICLALVGVVSVVFVGNAMAQDDAIYKATIQRAKAQYEIDIQTARIDYFKSIIAADDHFIGNLNEKLKAAMQNQDFDAVGRLSPLRTAAIATREAHARIGSSPFVQILDATVTATNETKDVTGILEAAITTNDRYSRILQNTYNAMPGWARKTLTIHFSVNGNEQTVRMDQSGSLPNILFPVLLPPDDPAYNGELR